jgi:hypothetical protein
VFCKLLLPLIARMILWQQSPIVFSLMQREGERKSVLTRSEMLDRANFRLNISVLSGMLHVNFSDVPYSNGQVFKFLNKCNWR